MIRAGRSGQSIGIRTLIILAVVVAAIAIGLTSAGDVIAAVNNFGDSNIGESEQPTQDVIGGRVCADQDQFTCIDGATCDSAGHRQSGAYQCEQSTASCCFTGSCSDIGTQTTCSRTEGCEWDYADGVCEG